MAQRRFFVPEVIQTSNLDCGPAALKCLLEGFGRHVSYGRLREACQTGVDGTSIDAIEAVANRLGLAAEQVMLPPEDLFFPEAHALPALVVVKLPIGLTHFVVVWRRHGRSLQVMDPACGRRWVRIAEFTRDIYRHTIAVAAEDWRAFAASEDFQTLLRVRLKKTGLPESEIDRLVKEALDDPSWRGLAALDARGREQWTVRPAAEPDRVLMSGAVLLRVGGLEPQIDAAALPPELAAAVTEPPARPFREMLGAALRHRGLLLALLLLAAALAVGVVAVEMLLLRGLFGAASGPTLTAIAGILLLLLLLEIPAFEGTLGLGRRSETLFRAALFKKLPRIADRYFHSRLISDMAERSHLVHRLRNLAPLTYQLLRTSFETLATAGAVIWLDPSGALYVAAILAAAFVPLFAALPLLNERDLRLRTHTGALTRFYLDAMLGLTAIRAQRAEASMQYEQEKLLAEWRRAARQFHFTAAAFEAVQLTAAFALVAWFVFVSGTTGGAQFLLLAYWTLRLPALAQEFGMLARQYPYHRNLALRLLELLGAPEEAIPGTGFESPHRNALHPSKTPAGELAACQRFSAPGISLRGVSVEVAGHTILENIDLTIEPGAHVAIVGTSGAGKSSLAGVLLGWFQPSAGEVLVGGRPLDVQALRAQTAWVDPAVQLWNRSLRANVVYGNESYTSAAVDGAELGHVIEKLPQGIDARLGEGGGLVSGGEGQRVRFARALAREGVRLAILDEPFRGLDREQRRTLLRRARKTWRDCTLLCITHDIAETESFDRVVVVEGGRIAEQGNPAELRARSGSRYAHLLASEEQIRKLWSADSWRRVRVEAGCVEEAWVETV